jgi:hypothetical protein
MNFFLAGGIGRLLFEGAEVIVHLLPGDAAEAGSVNSASSWLRMGSNALTAAAASAMTSTSTIEALSP